MPSMLKLPEDAAQRIARRLEQMTPALILLLDDAREHGATYLAVNLHRPGSDETVRLLLADQSVTITGESSAVV